MLLLSGSQNFIFNHLIFNVEVYCGDSLFLRRVLRCEQWVTLTKFSGFKRRRPRRGQTRRTPAPKTKSQIRCSEYQVM